MRNRLFILLFTSCLLVSTGTHAQIYELERSAPEAEGVPSKAILALFDSLMALPQTDIHSVMVLRHGKVIGEIYPAPFAPEYRHTMYSCSKTFVGTAIGLAIADNRLRLNDRIGTLLPEFMPDSISANLADMTVRNLLTMSSGITPDWDLRSNCSDWIRAFLAKPVKIPGKQFEYDSMNTYLLSAIIQKVSGMTLLDYLKLKLFHPMGIVNVAWEVSPEGINTGGWGLHIESESLAKFGLLLLNHGAWNGKQLLPEAWVKQMMNKQIDNGDAGYGYQMRQCEYPGAVRADGAYGQYILIIPEKDMVVVITECTLLDGSRPRGLVWNLLLPAVGNRILPQDKAYRLLQKKQGAYTLPVAQGNTRSQIAKEYIGREIQLEANKYGWESFRFQFKKNEVILKVTDRSGAVYELPFGFKRWLKTSVHVYPPYSISPVDAFKGIEGPFKVAGSYAWASPNALQLKMHYVNWISALDLSFRIDGSEVFLTVVENFSSNDILIKGKIKGAIGNPSGK